MLEGQRGQVEEGEGGGGARGQVKEWRREERGGRALT